LPKRGLIGDSFLHRFHRGLHQYQNRGNKPFFPLSMAFLIRVHSVALYWWSPHLNSVWERFIVWVKDSLVEIYSIKIGNSECASRTINS
jgi:hypothetical protein